MIGLIHRMLAASGHYKGRIYGAFVLSFFKGMLIKAPVIVTYFILTAFIDGSITKSACIYAAVALVVSVGIQTVLQYCSDRLQSAAGYMIFADMRMKLGKHLRRLPMGYFTEGNIGKISSVLSTDMVFIEENCMMTIADMMSYLCSQAIMVIFMFIFDVRLGIAALVISLLMLLIGESMKKSTLKQSAERQKASEMVTGSVIDFTEGIGLIKSYNIVGEKSRELTESFEHNCKVNLGFERQQEPWQISINLAYALGTAAMFGLCALLYHLDAISVSYFIGIMLFLFDMFVPMKSFYSQIARLTVMSACMDRIEEVFDSAELDDSGTLTADRSSAHEIEFKDVSFAYDKKDVLHNISFSADKNQMIALVGPSGGGKSTIAGLLARFWDIRSGEIDLRGTDIRKLPLASLMENISMVFQRVYLFQDTVYNNIALGRPSASREEIIEAAKKARCYEFIMQLPDGFDTVIGEGGASLSGGQAQRISIARCILKDSPIVILDEATASVDADNESAIQAAISELCRGKTLIVIAHRLNTIVNADKIIVVSDGRIAESGTHRELMQKDGIYKGFVQKQQQAAMWKI